MPGVKSARIAVTAAVSLFAMAAAVPSRAVDYAGTVFATGLNNPRDLAFAPDGSLYIAEGGTPNTGGPTTTTGEGVAAAGTSGSITRVAGGVKSTILTGLPSLTSASGAASGPQGIAFVGGTGYVVIGLGTDPARRTGDLASLGAAQNLGTLYAFDATSATRIADIAGYEASANPAGDQIDSNPYHLASIAGGVLVTDAGGNDLLRVTTLGAISTIATFPATGGIDSVPTGVAVGPDGAWYVGELTGAPFIRGTADIFRIDPLTGLKTVYASGFTNITDIAWGADSALYVLQFADNGIIAGGTGSIQRLNADGTHSTIYGGLVAPTGLAAGGDGALYVTQFSPAPAIGQVLRIAAIPEPATWSLSLLGFGLLGSAMRRRHGLAMR